MFSSSMNSHIRYCPHTVTVYNRATLKGFYIHIMDITKLLLSGGSIQSNNHESRTFLSTLNTATEAANSETRL